MNNCKLSLLKTKATAVMNLWIPTPLPPQRCLSEIEWIASYCTCGVISLNLFFGFSFVCFLFWTNRQAQEKAWLQIFQVACSDLLSRAHTHLIFMTLSGKKMHRELMKLEQQQQVLIFLLKLAFFLKTCQICLL